MLRNNSNHKAASNVMALMSSCVAVVCALGCRSLPESRALVLSDFRTDVLSRAAFELDCGVERVQDHRSDPEQSGADVQLRRRHRLRPESRVRLRFQPGMGQQ